MDTASDSGCEVRALKLRHVDDRRLGLLMRAIRRRRRWRQIDLATAAHISQSSVSRLERGLVGGLSVDALRRTAVTLGADVRIDILWRGGFGDRLLDERHAALGVVVTRWLQRIGWSVIPEVTFQRFGERGSIDLLGYREDRQSVCLIELKSVVHSYEDTQRRIDVKARRARDIAESRLGWRPRIVGVVLVIADTSTNRRRLSEIGPLVRAGLPSSTRDVRRWLADPGSPLRGTWFVRLDAERMRGTPASSRVRSRGRPLRS